MTAWPGPRLKPLTEKDMSEAQLKAAREFASGLRGQFNPWPERRALRPELMERTQKVGGHLRQELDPGAVERVRDPITAREWTAQTEWHAHHPPALKAG